MNKFIIFFPTHNIVLFCDKCAHGECPHKLEYKYLHIYVIDLVCEPAAVVSPGLKGEYIIL